VVKRLAAVSRVGDRWGQGEAQQPGDDEESGREHLLVAHTREVEPLWVPKFVSNEIQVSFAAKGVGKKL
jgi:hypothetical protein